MILGDFLRGESRTAPARTHTADTQFSMLSTSEKEVTAFCNVAMVRWWVEMGWVLFSMLILWSSRFHFLHTQMFVARRNHSLAVCAQQRKEVQPQFSASQLCRAPTSTPFGDHGILGETDGMEAANSGIQVEYGGIYIDEFSKMVASVLHIVSTLWAKESAAFLELAPLGKSRGSLTTWNGHQHH